MPTVNDNTRYLLTGGGSGGHITPLLAVADELHVRNPSAEIVTVGERGSKFAHLTENRTSITRSHSIFAGKFRRYHDDSLWQKLIDFRTNLLNVRDVLYFAVGFMQSLILIRKVRPDVVFLKGGFVGVPIGLAAAFWRVPIVTHDSDALPGLANRLVSRWVSIHATGMPPEYYRYSKQKMRHVGVLVGKDYKPVTDALKAEYRDDLALPRGAHVLFVTGGSLGSQRINRAVRERVDALLTDDKDLHIIHQVGRGNTADYSGFTHPRLRVLEFLDGMHRYSGAADVIVTRAGANTIAEFGVQKKACIVVPSPFLSGGHQLKNGKILEDTHAAIVVDEVSMVKDATVLHEAITALFNDTAQARALAKELHSLAVTGAVGKLCDILMEIAESRS